MKPKKGEYVIITNENFKTFLMKVRNVDDTGVSGILEDMCHVPKLRSSVTVKPKNVIAVLGEAPPFGKVYGIEASERYQGKKQHEHFGDIHFFYDIAKELRNDLWKGFDRSYSQLKKRGLEFLLEDIVWEVLPFHGGKYAGMFIHKKPKGDNIPPAQNRIQLKPEGFPASEFPLLITHELGHHLHTNFATGKKLNGNWIKLFNTSIRVQSIKKETSQGLLDQLLAQTERPSDFKRSLEEDDALSFKWIVKTTQQLNGISLKELDMMFEAEMFDEIKKVWPLRSISHKELQPAITEYACKSYKETFAECFAYYITGRKLPNNSSLPDPVVRLIEKTISYAKTNRPQ